jgi:hypothetical protein
MSDTPAPLSADSLREAIIEMLDMDKPKPTVNEVGTLIAAALQAERQRIADSLPPRIDEDAPMIGYKGDEEGRKLLKSWRRGRNEAIEAVRAVLIPPQGGLETPGAPAK